LLFSTKKGENMVHLFKHKKTNNIYSYLGEATEATNGREGINVVIYQDFDGNNMYVREKQEFEQKFESLRNKDKSVSEID